MKTAPIAAGMIAAVGATGSAHASLLWNFTFSAPGESASGTLTTNDLSGGSYLITGISGFFDGIAITGLLPTGSLLGTDDLLFPAPNFLDQGGVGFSLAGGGQEEIYGAEGGGGIYFSYDGQFASGTGSFSAGLAPVPEPASAGLFAAVLAGLAFLARRVRKA